MQLGDKSTQWLRDIDVPADRTRLKTWSRRPLRANATMSHLLDSPLLDSVHPFVEPLGRLMLAALLGSLLGIEREWHNRTAGFAPTR